MAPPHAADEPLPSEEEAEPPATGEAGSGAAAASAPARAARPRPPPPQFKFSTFALVFLGLLGFWMLIDPTARNGIISLLGTSPSAGGPFYTLIGFSSNHILLTMALAGAIEMLITAVAYNYTTDWMKAARIQKWSSAFRKAQMEAIRSGKKDRIAAMRPHQEKLTRLSSEVSIAQFKGMAVTWFLLIVIYTWVGTVISDATIAQQTVTLGGASVVLSQTLVGPIPYWFVIFSLYTVPLSLIFRRLLKHYWLQRYVEKNQLPLAAGSDAAGGSA